MTDPYFDDFSTSYWLGSDNDKTVTKNNYAWSTAECTTGPPANTDFYFEFVCPVVTTGSRVGFAIADVPDSGVLGGDVNSWGLRTNGQLYHNNNFVVGGYATWENGTRIGLLIKDGSVYFWIAGSGWQGVDDANSPVGKVAAVVGITDKIRCCVSAYGNTNSFEGKFVAADITNTTVPAGVQIGLVGAAPPSVYLDATLEQPYDIEASILQVISEQLYSLPPTLDISCEQLYSIVLEIWLTQKYGDVPWVQKNLIQPYKSVAILQKSLPQRWSYTLDMEISLEQEWHMPGLLQISSVQGYGIAAEVLHKTSEQLYHINERTQLFAGLSQPYAIAGETAQLYVFDTKLFINGDRIKFLSLEWQHADGYAWSCEFVVKKQETAVKCVEDAEIRIDTSGESYFLKCYDGWMLDKRFGAESYRIKGFSKTKDLAEGGLLLGDIGGGMASQIVTDLAAPYTITVDWQMADGYIPDGTIVANDESSLDVIKKIVWDAKGRLLSSLEGNLIVVADEGIAVPEYATVTPAATIVARLERISTSEYADRQKGFNKFIVSDQLASGSGRNLVKKMIDGRTAEIRLYVTPLVPAMEFSLTHTGPKSVSIEPFGVVTEEIVRELVEITGGAGRAEHPLYGITYKDWQSANLGTITFAEDGLLATEIKEYSLVYLSYVTKYYRWIARHPRVADVQFVADEVTI